MIRLPLPERITDTHAYFWGSVFSNWFEHTFEWEGIAFKNSETALMYTKACFFGDETSARNILESSHDPETVKKMGRGVTPYVDSEWAEVRLEIMVDILVAKFSSSQVMLNYLAEFKEHHIVEGSPVDGIWGVKLHWTNDRILDSRNWKGQNLLGRAIMMVQQRLGMRTLIPHY